MTRAHEFFFALARPLSPLYSGLMRLRAQLYRHRVLKAHRLPVPVISIGNLTMGGTGKTPCVMEVVRLLQAMGRRPAVVSRGYHGRARQPVNVVSDGRQVLLDARLAGDEPHLLAISLPGVPVLTGRQRPLVARYAVERLGADIIVLDDGFQHLALHRDLDLVLIKAPSFLGQARVFPGGELREPLIALHRAQAFILTGLEERYAKEAGEFRGFLGRRFPERPVFQATYEARGLIRLDDLSPVSLAAARQLRLCACCGLADPQAFRSTLARAGLQVADFKAFPDHHAYTARDLAELAAWAKGQGAEALVVTEKDLVKFAGYTSEIPVLALTVRFEPGEAFRRFLEGWLAGTAR